MNLQMDPDPDMLDPQLSMQDFSSLSGKEFELITIGPTMWQTPVDTLARFDIVKPQGYQPKDPNENIESNSAAVSRPYETSAQTTKATRTDSKSTIPSLASDSSGSPVLPPSKHSHPKIAKQQVSEPARKKKKRSKKGASGDEDE